MAGDARLVTGRCYQVMRYQFPPGMIQFKNRYGYVHRPVLGSGVLPGETRSAIEIIVDFGDIRGCIGETRHGAHSVP